jgi:hypothetical protein
MSACWQREDDREERVTVQSASTRMRMLGVVVPSAERLPYLDNLKTVLIAGIIASHALMGYATFGSWTYQDIQEVTLSDAAEKIYALSFLFLGGLFLMALFFLVSGLLTEDSLARKGPSRFLRDRALRLGVPFAVYTLVVWPLTEYAVFGPYLHRSFWGSVTDTDPVLDNGPLWFVGLLLLFSVALVAWRRVVAPPPPSGRSIGAADVAMLSVAVGAALFVVRLVFPMDSNQPLNVKVWGWPEYVAMFGLGIAASRNGWLRPVARSLARGCGIATLAAAAVVAAVAVSTDVAGLGESLYYGGWEPRALVWAFGEGVLAVCGPIWVLSFVQRHLNGTGPLRRAMARSSYLAFMLQGPVLIGLALGFRPLDLPGEVKALAVAALGIVVSFGLAWPLVTKTRLGHVV